MSDAVLSREDILTSLCRILDRQEKITAILEERLTSSRVPDEQDWERLRGKVASHLSGLVSMYEFSQSLPRDGLGIAAQAASSYLLKIQCTLAHVLLMVDMVHGQSFGEVYMDSLTTITSKVHEQFTTLRQLAEQRKDDPVVAADTLQAVMRLEREIDEDNIVICRQISVATEGESDFICYILRKIVRELEHISDYLKECAEIVAEI